MAALTKDWIRGQVGDVPPRRTIQAPVKAATKIFAGSIVSVTVAAGTGWARPAPGANTDTTIGVCTVVCDNTTGANGDQTVTCVRGNFPFHNDVGAPVLKENLGQVCFVLDDNTVTMTNTGQPAGKVTGIRSDGLIEVEIL